MSDRSRIRNTAFRCLDIFLPAYVPKDFLLGTHGLSGWVFRNHECVVITIAQLHLEVSVRETPLPLLTEGDSWRWTLQLCYVPEHQILCHLLARSVLQSISSDVTELQIQLRMVDLSENKNRMGQLFLNCMGGSDNADSWT